MRKYLSLFTAQIGLLAALAAGGCSVKGNEVSEIKFELGKNIHETAKASGAPKFQVGKTYGLVEYSIDQIPPQISVLYARPGYEIAWQPVFSMSMWADEARNDDLKVSSVTLQLKNTIRSHEAAQAFVEQTFAQFARGKWQRYFTEFSPRVTGRSSYLNEAGELDIDAASLDPGYKISAHEWAGIAKKSPRWLWIGDGVLATLTVRHSTYPGNDYPTYDMDLEFEIESIHRKRLADRIAEDNKRGDAEGWNSSAKWEEDKKELIKLRKILEANALKRGDSVLP